MYNKQKTISLILALAALVLGACSEKRDSDVDTNTSSSEIVYDGPTATLQADGVYDLEDQDGLKSTFALDSEGKSVLQLPSTDVTVRCIIKSTDPSQPTSYLTLKWKRSGTNGLYYTYKQAAFNLAAGTNIYSGDWYILGIIGGSNFRSFTTNGSFEMNTTAAPGAKAGETITFADAPFIFPWTKLTVVQVNGQPSLRVPGVVRFKPQGVLLRHHTINEMYTPFEIDRIGIYSNVMSFQGTFTFGTPVEGEGATWTPSAQAAASTNFAGAPSPSWSREYVLRNAANTANTPEKFAAALWGTAAGNWVDKTPADNKQHYLIWAMPAETTEEPHTAIFAYLNPLDASGARIAGGRVWHHIFYSGFKPTAGRSYAVRSVIRRPRMALEYMAETNLSGSKTFAANNLYKDASGNITEAYFPVWTVVPDPSSVLPDGYRLPDTDELRGIVTLGVRAGITATTVAAAVEEIEHCYNQHTASKLPFRATYVYDPANTSDTDINGARVVYGLRWTNQPFGGSNPSKNFYASAWRYIYIPNIGPETVPQAALRIEARYLGPSSTLTISDIANRAWWDNQSVAGDDEAVRILPLSGYDYDGQKYMVGKHGAFMPLQAYLPENTANKRGVVAYYRPENMGVVENYQYSLMARRHSTTYFPHDVSGVDYPVHSNSDPLLQTKLSLPIRPFKIRTFKERFLPQRTTTP